MHRISPEILCRLLRSNPFPVSPSLTLFKIDVHTSLGTLGGFRTFGTCLSFIWRIYVTQAFCFTVEQWCDIGRYSDIGNLGVTSLLATHLIMHIEPIFGSGWTPTLVGTSQSPCADVSHAHRSLTL